MTNVELMAELELCGVTLSLRDDRLLVDAPKSTLTQALRTELAQQKVQIMEILRSRAEGQPTSESKSEVVAKHLKKETYWPKKCIESRRRFGRPHAVLFPLIGRTVQTPQGGGRLFNVTSTRDSAIAGVVLEGEDRVTFVPTADLKPSNGKLR